MKMLYSNAGQRPRAGPCILMTTDAEDAVRRFKLFPMLTFIREAQSLSFLNDRPELKAAQFWRLQLDGQFSILGLYDGPSSTQQCCLLSVMMPCKPPRIHIDFTIHDGLLALVRDGI